MARELMNRRGDWLVNPFYALGRSMFEDADELDVSKVLKTDVKETEASYVAKIEVPGIKKDDIKMSYHDNVLSVSVKKDDFSDHADAEGNLLMSERSYGAMSRSYRLPNVDEQHIKAAYDAGVLTVTLPKLTETPANPHQIEID